MRTLLRDLPSGTIIFAVGCILLVGCVLLWLPEWMANQYRFKDAKDWAEQVAANRAMLVNLLGGVAVAITIYFTYQNFRVAQSNVKLTQDRLITETFSKAIEQLGHTDLAVRLGGIHSLARIAKSSQGDYFPVMQVLTGFLRNKYRALSPQTVDTATSPGASNCPVEVATILTIIGERYWPDPDGYVLDLSYIDIRDAWVPGANFRDMFFWSARLTNWNFESANLIGADFKGATLDGCDFTGADLTKTNLEGTIILAPRGLTGQQLRKARQVPPALYSLIQSLNG